jgi:hypothetical protein
MTNSISLDNRPPKAQVDMDSKAVTPALNNRAATPLVMDNRVMDNREPTPPRLGV